MVETTANTACTSITTTTRSAYLKHTPEFRQLVAQAQTEDVGFYRFEKDERRSKNDGAWVGYPSASIFSSTANAALTDFYETLGMEGSMNAYAVTGMTPFIRSIFDIKYILSSEPLNEQEGLLLYGENNGAYLYQNQSVLPVGFMVPADMNEQWQPEYTNPAIAQNAFSIHSAGTGNLLDPIADTNPNGGTFEIHLEEAGHVFVQVDNSQVEDVDAVIGEHTESWSHVDRGFFLDLGWCTPEETIRLTTEQDASLMASAYIFRYDNLNAMTQILNQQPLQVTSYSDTVLNGVVNVQEKGLLFTSIPYDNGWILTVDGQEQEIQVFANALISVPLEEGRHEIHLEYHAPGRNLGLMLSSSTVIVICLILLGERLLLTDEGRKKWKQYFEKKNENEASREQEDEA